MLHHSTPLGSSNDANISFGPSFKTICMLQLLARTYKPEPSKDGRFNKHSLA